MLFIVVYCRPMVGQVGHHNMRIIENHAYVKTLYDAWIPEFGSGMDPAGFRVVGSGSDPDPAGSRNCGSGWDLDPAGSRMSGSGWDPDPAGSENCGSGAPLFTTSQNSPSVECRMITDKLLVADYIYGCFGSWTLRPHAGHFGQSLKPRSDWQVSGTRKKPYSVDPLYISP